MLKLVLERLGKTRYYRQGKIHLPEAGENRHSC